MERVFKVFKLLIDEKLDIFKGKKNLKATIKSIIKLVLSIIVVTVLCTVLAGKITVIGVTMDVKVLSLILLVTQIIAFFMSLGSIINNLYLCKDSELLMCMPATHNQIFIAKLMAIYVCDFISNLLYFSPIFLMYAFTSTASVGIWYYLLLPFFLLILPILPMVLAAFVSIPVMLLLKFLKKHIWVYTSVIVVGGGVLLYLYMELVGNLVTSIDLTTNQIGTAIEINNMLADFAEFNVVYTWIANGMLGQYSYLVLPVLLIVGVGLLFLITLLVRPFYFKLATSQGETETKEKTNEKCFINVDSSFTSLVKKEFLMTFRTPGYIFQYFIFVLLMPFIVFVYDKLLIAITVSKAGKVMIAGAHVLVLSILATLSCTISASALSREGGNYYIMKIVPVSFKKQTMAKVVFNMIVVTLAILVTTIASLVFININPYHIVMSSIIVLFISLGQICWNYDLDLRNPKLDWYDSGEITSISKNTAYSMIIGLAISFVFAYLTFLFINISVIWYILLFIAIFYAISRMYLLKVRINHYFKINEI